MDQGVHFIAGLPRSGSTLLAAILRQNPRFHAAMSSPLGGLYTSLEQAMSRRNEAAVFIDEAQRRHLLAGLFDGYYHAVHRQQLVFDTNRLWCTRMPALTTLFPDAKLICCVRPISWIMDSVERLIRKNAFEVSGLFDAKTGATVYTRMVRLAASDGMVGYALDALREAYFGEHASRLLLIDYEALAREPERTLDALYAFLGEPRFAHDFEQVSYEADAFDLALGTPGLHRVQSRVQWQPRPTVLPPDLFERFEHDAFWRLPQVPGRGAQRILPSDPA